MRRDEALAIQIENQEELKNLGVKSLSLFGSVARDEARPDSDVKFKKLQAVDEAERSCISLS